MTKSKENDNSKYDSICLDNQLCFPLYACAKEVIRKYREPLAPLGLTYTQYVVMMVLWERGSLSEGELGKNVHLDSGTLTPLLKRLEKQGYIKRIRPETNERRLLLELTPEGKALREEALRVPEQMNGCIPLTKEELLELRALLKKALSNMDQ